MKDHILEMFSCPVCLEENIGQENPDELLCRCCGQKYAVEKSIPILLKNSENILDEVKDRLNKNPQWYSADQIQYAENGPYRHHLKKRYEYLISLLNSYSFNAPKMLDAGCGDGINLRHLVGFCDSAVFGIDYNLIRLLRAQVNCQNKAVLVLGSLLEKTFKEESFDIILCNHVLEHIQDDIGVLKNLQRYLKKGGVFILGVPNEGAFLWKLNYRIIQPDIMKTTDHVHFYKVENIRALLEKSKFKILEVKHIGWGVPHTGIDAKLRQYKWIDDLFDVGRWICKSQSTSLYFVCGKD